MKINNKSSMYGILWILQGILVGFGAIMPGISGGTLCVAFGMYLPIIGVLSHPKANIPKYWKMLFTFGIGGVIGFIGLSGLASWLLTISSELVTCAFIGFIIGTFPELWSDAGTKGRTKNDYFMICIGFIFMLVLLNFMQTNPSISIKADTFGYLISGVLWGLSFIVPGLSSSTLLLFFGLYQPMLDGIASFNMAVLIPLGIGMLACVVILSKAVNLAYEKHYSLISHFIIGVVAATTIMILPEQKVGITEFIYRALCIVGGALLSYALTCICAKLKEKQNN